MVVAALTSTSSANAITSCPPKVTADITLANDLTCALWVDGSGLTIDLNGHVLFGYVHSYSERVTVRNGTIDRGGESFAALSLRGSQSRIERVEVRNALGFGIEPGPGTVIDKSRVVDSGAAIDLFWGDGVTVERSTLSGNRVGILIGSANGSVIRDNHFSDNDEGLRIWDEDLSGASNTTVSGNVFSGNRVGANLLARNEASGTRFTNNLFRGSDGPGLEVVVGCLLIPLVCNAGAGTLIDGNRFVDNGGSGALYVHGSPERVAGVTVTGNTTVRSEALGFDATGVSDGGGNIARSSGDRRGCLGIAC